MKVSTLVLFCGLLLATTQVCAQSNANLPLGDQLQLSVAGEFGTVDNFLYASSNEKSTGFWSLSPALYMQLATDTQLLSFDFSTDINRFNHFANDEHTNVTFSPRYLVRMANNQTLSINADYRQQYELRGTGLSLGNADLLTKGDDKASSSVSLGYQIGDELSTAMINVALGIKHSKYQTRRSLTKQLDHRIYFGSIAFDYRLSGGTFIATEIGTQKLSYQYQELNDKTKVTLLAGIKWPKSVVSQFYWLMGYQKVDFNHQSLAKNDAVKWRLGWRWSPVESMQLSIASERDFDEANRLANSYRLIDRHSINIENRFSNYFTLTASAAFNQEEVIYQDHEEQEDYLNADIKLNYQVTDDFNLFVRYRFNDLQSSHEIMAFQRNSISLGFDVTL